MASDGSRLDEDDLLNAVVRQFGERYRRWRRRPSPYSISFMSTTPIPPRLLSEFLVHMAAREPHDVSDGVWWVMLEEAAEDFIQQHGLAGDRHNAVHQYLRRESSSRRKRNSH